MPTWGTIPDTDRVKATTLTMNLAQAAGTYDAGTVSGGTIMLLDAVVYVATAGATFTSVSVQTNTTSPVELLSAVEGAVANVTGGKNLKVFTTRTIIPSGSKIQFTIVGVTGTGSLQLHIRYQPMANGAVIA